MNKTQNVLIFDFEVDQYDWLVRFKYLDQDKWVNIHNSKDALVSLLKTEHASLFVGFNNKNYDDYIISAILNDRDPYEVSQQIIEKGLKGWQTGLKRPSIATMDLKQDNFDNNTLSLKEAEANMGLSIEESSVPFNLGRKWTYNEIMEMAEYCGYDVLGTEKLFHMRSDWINTKATLVNQECLGKYSLGDTNAQLTAKILKATKWQLPNDSCVFNMPEDLKLGKYEEILKYFENGIPEDFNLDYRLANLDCKLGLGGLHGAEEKFISSPNKKYVIIDVETYYPMIMIGYKLLSRTVENKHGFLGVFRKLQEATTEAERKAYKQVLVNTYGAMDNKYNKLYDPRMRKNVAVTGQLFLIDLIDKIENHCELVQINTDGLIVEIKNQNALVQMVTSWEKRTGFKMKYSYIDKLYQKDVNNYFAKFEDGSITVKGSYLKQASHKWDGYSRNNMRVVDLAVKEFLDKGTEPEVFIKNHTNLNDFQIVVKDKQKMVEVLHGQIINTHQKVNRIFATVNYTKGALCKLVNGTAVKIPNTPLNSYVHNGNIMNIDVNALNLDYKFYIDMAINRLVDYGVKGT